MGTPLDEEPLDPAFLESMAAMSAAAPSLGVVKMPPPSGPLAPKASGFSAGGTLMPPDWREKLGGLRPATMPAQIPGLPEGADPSKLLAGISVPKVASLGLRDADGQEREAPTSLQMPGKLDPQLIRDTLDRVQRTQLVQGALSRGPASWYTMKHGISTDLPHNAGWDAAKGAAGEDLQVAQMGAQQNAAQTGMLNEAAKARHADESKNAQWTHDLQKAAVTGAAGLNKTQATAAAAGARQDKAIEFKGDEAEANRDLKTAEGEKNRKVKVQTATPFATRTNPTDGSVIVTDKRDGSVTTPTGTGAPPTADKRLDKWQKELQSDLDTTRSRSLSALGMNQKRIDAADRVKALYTDRGGDLRNLDSRQQEELAISLQSLLSSSGQAAQAQVKALVPHTAVGDIQKMKEFLFNEPTGLNQQEFTKRMAETVERERELAAQKIGESRLASLSRHSNYFSTYPDKAKAQLKGYGLDPSHVDRLNGKAPAAAPAAAVSDEQMKAFLKSLTEG